ncbi:DUF1080 domain-containing protein [Tamlana agarivorans]|uniref:DUF1080 domain-containing protein n=1 Tax=Pseudotamlana agarivorans TaxID=481183 RepID=A0ACC5U975_9FLAO|nr:DUF1080 domain-containing protein [Tamlana agarivorans]MBU2950878.1 DUF1080 domain-containing protein [Tamlana agarivorans]
MVKQSQNLFNATTFVAFLIIWVMPVASWSQNINEAIEPNMKGKNSIDLLETGTLADWKVPSKHWSLVDKTIIGNTGGKVLFAPEWIYTKQQFSDFEFTCEMKLTGDKGRNTGLYFRMHPINFIQKKGNKTYVAASGYEFDAGYHHPGKKNMRGTLGDWYARPKLRVFPDQKLINELYKADDWNRLTIRARGNRIEYWMNAVKILDFVDTDPKGSRKGSIGFQIHDGSVMQVAYRNLVVRTLNPNK